MAPGSRPLIWKRALGNELAVTEASFSKALQRAQDLKAKLDKEGVTGFTDVETNTNRRMKQCFESIRRDCAHVFPDLHLFQENGPYHDSLVEVLDAYALYRSDVGYVFGVHVSYDVSDVG